MTKRTLSCFAVALLVLALPQTAQAQKRGAIAAGIGAGIIGGIILNEMMKNQQPQQQEQRRPRPRPAPDDNVAVERKAPTKDRAIAADDIQEAQQALNKLGFDVGEPDGRAGERTVLGIKSFQNVIGDPVTGTLTRRQFAELQRRASLSPGAPVAVAPVPPPPAASPAVADASRPRVPAPPASSGPGAGAPIAPGGGTIIQLSQRFDAVMQMGRGEHYYVQSADIAPGGDVAIGVREVRLATDSSQSAAEALELRGALHNLMAIHDANDPKLVHLGFHQPDAGRQVLLYTVSMNTPEEAHAWGEKLQIDIDALTRMATTTLDPYATLKGLRTPRS